MNGIKKFISFKNISLFYFFLIVTIPLTFFIRIIYSRTLSIQDFGLIYSIIAFITIVSQINNFGFSTSLRHLIPEFIAKKDFKKITSMFYYSIISQIAIFIIIMLLLYSLNIIISTYYFKDIIFSEQLPIIILFLLSLIFFRTFTDIFVSFKLNIYFQFFRFLQLFLILLFAISGIIFNIKEIKFYLISWSLMTFFITIIMFLILILKFPFFKKLNLIDIKYYKKYLKISSFNFSNSIATQIFSQIDILMITYFLPIIYVSYYSNSSAILLTISTIFTSLGIIFLPLFSELKAKEEFKQLKLIYNSFNTILLYLILPITLILFFFSKTLISILFGKEYLLSGELLSIFSLFLFFKIYFSFNISFLNGLGEIKKISKVLFLIVILNIILNIVLVKLMGVYGIMYATIFSWMLGFILTYKLLSKTIEFNFDFYKLFKIIVCNLVLIIVLFSFKYLELINNFYINSFVGLSISGIIYLFLGLKFKIFSINEIKNYVLKR